MFSLPRRQPHVKGRGPNQPYRVSDITGATLAPLRSAANNPRQARSPPVMPKHCEIRHEMGCPLLLSGKPLLPSPAAEAYRVRQALDCSNVRQAVGKDTARYGLHTLRATFITVALWSAAAQGASGWSCRPAHHQALRPAGRGSQRQRRR
jgi:hypothetical protein